MGFDSAWLFVRRNDCAYICNKLFSFMIATGLAVATASYKPLLQQMTNAYPDADNIKAYNFLYWLIFIYYSFAALDELLELYREFFKVPKSSIGLLFELNTFLGVGIMMYLGKFYYTHMDTVPQQYKALETFLGFQVSLLYLVGAICLFMWVCMCMM